MMPSDPSMLNGDRSCGARLRTAREAAGLSEADVGARLKIPIRVVQSLEAEDWSRLGAPVFARGQLRSYSRLLGLTTAPVFDVEPTVLTPRTFTPPMQRLAEHTARRLVYIVLTAAIAVPVWLATRPHMKPPTGSSTPLDLPTKKSSSRVPASTLSSQVPVAAEPATVLASMTPLPSPAAAASAVTLRLTGESWVQVLAPDGRALEESLLRAGQQRSYAAGEVARIVIGNAAAVTVLRKGQAQDLAPYLHANVARFTVSSDGSLAAVAD